MPAFRARLGYVWIAYVALGVAALANSGCLLVAAGVAGGVCAADAYRKGKVCGLFNADIDHAIAATHKSLEEMGMAVRDEERHPNHAFIESRTADGERVRIYLEEVPSRIPADVTWTRVAVRIATFGDRPTSERILDQVATHLVPATLLDLPPAVPSGTETPAQTPAVGMTDAIPSLRSD